MMMWEYERIEHSSGSLQLQQINHLAGTGWEWVEFAPDGSIWMRRKVADHRVTSDDGDTRILADAS